MSTSFHYEDMLKPIAKFTFPYVQCLYQVRKMSGHVSIQPTFLRFVYCNLELLCQCDILYLIIVLIHRQTDISQNNVDTPSPQCLQSTTKTNNTSNRHHLPRERSSFCQSLIYSRILYGSFKSLKLQFCEFRLLSTCTSKAGEVMLFIVNNNSYDLRLCIDQ